MQAPTPKLGDCQGPCGTLVNAVVDHLHNPRWHGIETLLHFRPSRRHHADSGDCCLVEGVEAAAIFHRQLGGDAGVVISIPVKEDCLCRLLASVIC